MVEVGRGEVECRRRGGGRRRGLNGVGYGEGEFMRRGGEETRFGWSRKRRRGV